MEKNNEISIESDAADFIYDYQGDSLMCFQAFCAVILPSTDPYIRSKIVKRIDIYESNAPVS